MDHLDSFNVKHNDSLADMEEKYMQDSGTPSPRSRNGHYSFIRGPSSFDLLVQQQQTKKPKTRLLSKCGVIFLVFALLQAIIIAGIQIAIAVLGDFNGGRLEQYVPCVMEEYDIINKTLLDNSTFPSFGKDKEIYVYIFIFLAAYNFTLCLYALLAQRIVEVGSFVFINFLLIIYGSVQVYQFRGFGDFCDPVTQVGWLALTNVLVVFVFNIMFVFLALQIYVEFGWKVYKFVNCNPALRFYYRNYEVFLSILKTTIVFTIAFLVGQAALILPLNNYEFWLTGPFILGLILLYLYAFFMVRRESHTAFMVLIVIGILLTAYFGFKVYRYVTRSCPVCSRVEQELNDRREDFQHLIMIASLNMIITLGFILSLIRVWTQFGKGLADHFYIHGYWFDRVLRKKPGEEAFLNSVGTGTMMKKRSTALLLRVKPLSLDETLPSPITMQRNSSLDEKDYVDWVFTPTTSEYKPLSTSPTELQSLEHPFTDRSNKLNPVDINRTFSLPPILEHTRNDKHHNNSKDFV